MFAKKVRENPDHNLLQNQEIIVKAAGYEILAAMLVECLGIFVLVVPTSVTDHFEIESFEMWQPRHSEIHSRTNDKEATAYAHTTSKEQVII